MTALRTGEPSRDGVLKRPFCRGTELADIVAAIREEDCRAVFLTSDSGLGASTILRELVAAARDHVPVLAVPGSSSLANIPFGVLVPYLNGLSVRGADCRMVVLRAVLAEIDRQDQALPAADPDSPDLPLMVIDDAHSIDGATADLVVGLVMAGTINVVVSHSCRHKLPAPLSKLWDAGMAENIVLRPLDREQGHEFCEAMLGGPVLRASSWHFWHTAAGNPLFLHLLATEAVAQGVLARRRGTWTGGQNARIHSSGLEDAVRAVLRGLSPGGREAVNLVALAEPLPEPFLHGLVAPNAVRELLDWQLVAYQPPSSGLLVLANPLHGQVIRKMVPVAKSRVLHQQLTSRFEDGGGGKSLLRRVMWAVEVGVQVPDATLLRTAVLAANEFQPATALDLAGRVGDGKGELRAAMVQARAKYSLGDHHGAFVLMDALHGRAADADDMLMGGLLRAATRSALGMAAATLRADAADMLEAGRELAGEDPANSETIMAQSHAGSLAIELMALAREGRYADMAPLATLLSARQDFPAAAGPTVRALVLNLDAERLTAQGFPEQGARRAAEALALAPAGDGEEFFLPERILLRQAAALLCAGRWAAASGFVEQFSLESGGLGQSPRGGAGVVRGVALLRAGRHAEALAALEGALDNLQPGDPQQLLGLCTAMAAYAAACLGREKRARRYMAEHAEGRGMFLMVAHERAYLAAARHLLQLDGGGPAGLLVEADAARKAGSAMLELNALALLLELGETGAAERTARVAAAVEGPWARALGHYADALHLGDSRGLARAAESLARAGLAGLATMARGKFADRAGGASLPTPAAKEPRTQRRAAGTHRRAKAAVSGMPAAVLTGRQRQVAALAATGMTDREIAGQLDLALRTVEGHLYKSYSKLGISTREELAETL